MSLVEFKSKKLLPSSYVPYEPLIKEKDSKSKTGNKKKRSRPENEEEEEEIEEEEKVEEPNLKKQKLAPLSIQVPLSSGKNEMEERWIEQQKKFKELKLRVEEEDEEDIVLELSCQYYEGMFKVFKSFSFFKM